MKPRGVARAAPLFGYVARMADNRLTALDSSFLHLEDAATHMHVASVILFEGDPPPYDELLAHIEGRLHLVPRYRQKLAFVPFGQGRPRWVDDPHLNLRYHVRSTALPSPGSEEQLKALASRVFSQQLDRDKPLWEFWLVEGVEGGGFAVLAKTHHALVDGISGVDIVTVLFDTSAEPAAPADPGERWLPRPLPSRAQLLGEALVERGDRARRGRPHRAGGPARAAPDRRAGPRRRGGRRGDGLGRPERGARRAPTTRRSAPTAASPGSAPASPTSRRSRTSSAAPSTTSCWRRSPAPSAGTCAGAGRRPTGWSSRRWCR